MLPDKFVPHEKLGKIGIVMSGCGLRSVIYLGHLRSLVKHGLAKNIFYFFGVSGSALTLSAPSMARSPEEFPVMLARAEKEWMRIARGGPKTIFNFPDSWWKVLFSKYIHFKNVEGLLDNAVLYDLLRDYDPELTVQSPIRFDIRVFNHISGKYEIISNCDPRFRRECGGDPEMLRHFIVASACLDFFFPPVHIGDSYYSDGDSVDILPAIKYGCDTIFVFSGHEKAYKASEGGAYAKIKNRAPVVIRSILNKYNSLRQQDEHALQKASRCIEQIVKERDMQAEHESVFVKTLSSVRRAQESVRDMMRAFEKNPSHFFFFAWRGGWDFWRDFFSTHETAKRKFPQTIHFYADDAVPKSLIPTSFNEEEDIIRAMEAAERQLDTTLETML